MVYIGFILQVCPSHSTDQPSAEVTFGTKQLPFAQSHRYTIDGALIHRSRYNRYSLVMDHYEIQHANGLTFDIPINRPIYTLIAQHTGEMTISSIPGNSSLRFQPGYCGMVFCAPGTYTITLDSAHQHIDLLGIDYSIIEILYEEFELLQAFVEQDKSSGIHSMPLMQVDKVFIRKLAHLLYPKVPRAKDYNSHLLQYLPGIVSAYKGLVHGKDQRSYDAQKLEEICQYIRHELNEHYTTPPVEHIAHHAFISHDKLGKLFERLHMTPKQYIQQEKMKLIAAYLLDSDKSISALADQFGFSDNNALIKSFKSVHGISPGAYRTQNRL
ncbi:helix-turn-helix transcriptional regulator [Sphingobacterium olei]|uniref:Helix-turn-helix transcriptional regulator n=1 Tax=Sphingobacterium olei TaxID=2571155 RepID=A0A4U0P6G5_9SPHI|nr:AraC family transcriptional regulator [Sphingobacterium olei]TJZ63013.1 helix-turn-helix transcriptional regulator [Sphingobacterium olei]